MKNKSPIIFITVLVLIVVVSGCVYDIKNAANTGNQNSQNASAVNYTSTADVKITPQEAKNIAQKYINQSGAAPGEPMLKTEGNKIYIVPIIVNGNLAGEIIIDAQTGENLGGVGGVLPK